MTRKGTDSDLDDAIQAYVAGDSAEDVAQRFHGLSEKRLVAELRARRLFRTLKESRALASSKQAVTLRAQTDATIPVAVASLVADYRAGVSEQALARRYGIDRRTVRRRLFLAGVQPRNRSEAMKVRMARTDAAERKRLVSAAHLAHAVSAEKSRYLEGAGEAQLAGWVADRGIALDRQLAVGTYNLDLAIEGTVAVEVHVSASNPMNVPRLRKRTEDLCGRGWAVVYVWVTRGGFLTEAAADYVVAFAQEAKRDPSLVGQYRVIRGTGELVASGSSDLHD